MKNIIIAASISLVIIGATMAQDTSKLTVVKVDGALSLDGGGLVTARTQDTDSSATIKVLERQLLVVAESGDHQRAKTIAETILMVKAGRYIGPLGDLLEVFQPLVKSAPALLDAGCAVQEMRSTGYDQPFLGIVLREAVHGNKAKAAHALALAGAWDVMWQNIIEGAEYGRASELRANEKLVSAIKVWLTVGGRAEDMPGVMFTTPEVVKAAASLPVKKALALAAPFREAASAGMPATASK